MKQIRLWILGAFAVFLLGIAAQAQTAQISGTVADPKGAAVVGAEVQVSDLATRNKHVTKTDGSGSYSVTNLADGYYVVAVSAPGFGTSTSAALTIASGQSLSYDVQLKIASAMSTVNVNEQRDGTVDEGYKPTTAQTTGPWDTLPIQDTPYQINVMSSDLIENMAVVSTDELYRVNPVIQQTITGRYFVNFDGEVLRGFYQNPFTGGRFEDGMRSSVAPPSFEDVERVEVLTGLSGFLYGANHVGGIVNYVTKRPTAEQLANVTTGWDGNAFLSHLDIGGPLTRNNKVGYRMNLATQNAPAGIDGISRQLGTLALNWQAKKKLLLDFDYWLVRRQSTRNSAVVVGGVGL